MENSEENRELRHALGNAQAENNALKSLLGKAADRLEDVVEADCSDEEQQKALDTAERFRKVLKDTEDRHQQG